MRTSARRSTFCIALACFLFLEACTVGPKYKRPIVPVPDSWRVSGGQGASLANEKWWELLKDPVLQQLIRTALVQNTDIRLAASRVAQAQAQVTVARSAQFPQVSADPAVARERPLSTSSGAPWSRRARRQSRTTGPTVTSSRPAPLGHRTRPGQHVEEVGAHRDGGPPGPAAEPHQLALGLIIAQGRIECGDPRERRAGGASGGRLIGGV